MAKPFARINLSESGLFFRPVALEPGCPLFDPTNANDKILFRWFGGLTPEPEWDELEEKIYFYVRNDQGGRVEDVTCQTVTNEDLNENLVSEIERLQQRFDRIRPVSTTEKILYEKLSEEFHDLIENKKRPDRTYYFFKYQDAAGLWRLVWICGYQPIHQEYGTPMLCDDSQCGELYIRLPGKKAVCPICLKAPSAQRIARERAKRKRRRAMWAFLFLLLLLWVIWNQFSLLVTPGPWSGYVGTVADFKVRTPGIDGFGFFFSKDVTYEVLGQVADPTIAHFLEDSTRALACSPGETEITFFTGYRWKKIHVTVRPPVNPQRVWLEPENVELAVGSVARVRMMGEYEDGGIAELSASAAWKSKNDGTVYHFNGFLEGLQTGESVISAGYRATPKDPVMDAQANILVKSASFEKLSLSVLSGEETLPPGKNIPVKVEGTDSEGKVYNFAGSSRLRWTVDPPSLIKIGGEKITTSQTGSGRLQVELLDDTPQGETLLAVEREITVEAKSRFSKLRVSPKELTLVLDQKLPLSIIAPDDSQLKITSNNQKIVAVDRKGSLIGRGPGSAEVTVSCGDESQVVMVTVSAVQPDALYLRGEVAAVPVDHEQEMQFFARSGSEKYYEVSSEAVKVESRPSARFAGVDPLRMSLKGYNTTVADEPQKISWVYRGQKTSASVHVVPAPLRLSITPAGTVELPLGLCMTFDGNAVYGDGVRVLVPYTRMEWMTDPQPEEVKGFDFVKGKAMALDVGVGPVNIWGKYFGKESNHAILTTTERADVTLSLEVDRNLRIQGETGQVMLRGRTAQGDVELVPNIGKFESRDKEIIGIQEEKAGIYKAASVGVTAISATHPASENAASVDLRVVHPRNARLFWSQEEVKVAVDEVTPFQLMLEGRNPDAKEGEESVWTVPMNSPGVYYSFAKPEAVDWQTSQLTGLQETAPFEVTASYIPYVKLPAKAMVEVFSAQSPAGLRVIPSEVTLAPGQALALQVQEQLEGAGEFTEVYPESVVWTVPRNVYWTPPYGVLRPVMEMPLENAESVTVSAKYRGKTAQCRVNVGVPSLSVSDPEVELFVKRQPEGVLLPVGRMQQFSVWMRKGEVEEPAQDVRFTPNFENDSLAWEAPTVYSLKPGYTHWFQAKVGDRQVRWYTHTVDPFVPGEMPPPPEGAPSEVRILSNSGTEVEMGVGARYVDYRVEAEWEDGTVRTVTKDAILHPTDGDRSIVSPVNGELLGLKPGKVTFLAEYMGVDSTLPTLTITVTPEIEADTLKLEPSRDIRMMPEDTVRFNIHGYKADKSVGLLPDKGDVVWKSDNPAVARPEGATTLAVSPGNAKITAEMLGKVSSPAEIIVVTDREKKLNVTDSVIPMLVGESKYIGKDFEIRDGNINYSFNCRVTPLNPEICEYDAARHALVGKSDGATEVLFASGDRVAKMIVKVGNVPPEILARIPQEGKIVVEPEISTVSVGQIADLRVYEVLPDGFRRECTAEAIFRSSDPAVCKINGLQVCALKPGGPVTISVLTPNIPQPDRAGKAMVTVDTHPITELVVDPLVMKMSVGDRGMLFISGRSASGLRSMFSQPDLKLNVEGNSVQVQGTQYVEAVQAGKSLVHVDWKNGQAKRTVSVDVDNSEYSSLALDPMNMTVEVGQGLPCQVTALRGGRIYVLTPEDGLVLMSASPNIASTEGNIVYGKSPGRTGIVARFHGLTAEGEVNVVPAGSLVRTDWPPVTVIDADDRPALIVDDPWDPNRVVVHDGDGWRYDGIYREGEVLTGDSVTVPVGEEVAGLIFDPPFIRVAKAGGAVPVRVYEAFTRGGKGRDVTNDPDLKLSTSSQLISLERAADGTYLVRPTGKEGETRVRAEKGSLSAIPLRVQVGDVPVNAAFLSASPDPLQMTVGDEMPLDAVRVVPQSGVMPFEIPYRVSLVENNGVVTVSGTNVIRATAAGTARLQVSSVDPSGAYDGLSTYVTVNVTPPLSLSISPVEHTMRVGDVTPSFVVTGRDASGTVFPVPAVLTTDASILMADTSDPTRFRAVSMGQTQVRAMYGGSELFATVSVSGDRFLNVDGQLNEGDSSFSVTLSVSAAAEAGALEYRVYEAGSAPAENWQPGTLGEGGQNVMLNSPQIQYHPSRTHEYKLVVESRPVGGGAVQKYPYNFQLRGRIEKAN
ncbi:MAG: hypothetical protein Q4C96_00750 [Planctomycetia bacterium]|nr:hypothetical protein [Planctomycetia bacterium]